MGLSLIVFSIRILLCNSLHRLFGWRCIFFIRCWWFFFFVLIDIENRLIWIWIFIFNILNIKLSLFNLVCLLFIWRWTFFFFLFVRSFLLSFRLLLFVFLITLLFLFFWQCWGLNTYINIFFPFCTFIHFPFTWVWFRIIIVWLIIRSIILVIVPIMRIAVLIVVIVVILLVELPLLLFILLTAVLWCFASSLKKVTKYDELTKMKYKNLPIRYLSTNCSIIWDITYYDFDNLLGNHLFPNNLLHLILIL